MRCLIHVLLLSTPPLAWSTPVVAPAPPPAEREAQGLDAGIDVQLADLDRYAARYPSTLEDELRRYQDTPRDLIVRLRTAGWSYSRIYAACVTGRIVGRPCRLVVDTWAADPAQRWDTVAGRFGIDPGSNALGRMKDAMTQTYGRLGRPLPAPPAD